jgi:molecular chaperone GrpE
MTDTTDETPPQSRPNTSAHDPTDEATEESLLAQMQNDVDRFKDLALRTQADFENFRKRAAREKEEAAKYANAAFLERLLPILDSFELGLNAARSGAKDSPILAGMEMVAKQLEDFLLSVGVEPIKAEGQPFDPNLHEAVAQEASADVPEGVIVRQLRKGFKLRDRLLRPATVMVSKGSGAS